MEKIMIYKVKIEETVCDEFEVEADSEEEAFKIATKQYDDGKIVLEPGKLISKQISIADKKGNPLIDWEEF